MSENASRNSSIAYWRSLWPHIPRPKTFLPIRVVPSLVISFVSLYSSLYRHKLSTPAAAVKETLILAAISIAVYFALYALEFSWNFAVVTPPILDRKRLEQLQSKDAELTSLREGDELQLDFTFSTIAANAVQLRNQPAYGAGPLGDNRCVEYRAEAF
jgi:hypothetical protein